jgi:choline dehydrogenase-like flavoprotein
MGKVVGGTSKLNSIVYLRGHIRDYDLWEEHGNVGWAYENVLPYFKKSENQRGRFKHDGELSVGCTLQCSRNEGSMQIANLFQNTEITTMFVSFHSTDIYTLRQEHEIW